MYLDDEVIEGMGYVGHGMHDEDRKDGVTWTSQTGGDQIDSALPELVRKRRLRRLRFPFLLSCNSCNALSWVRDMADSITLVEGEVGVLGKYRYLNYMGSRITPTKKRKKKRDSFRLTLGVRVGGIPQIGPRGVRF
jgi:hypothetical protein